MEATYRINFDDVTVQQFEKVHGRAVSHKDYDTAILVTNTMAALYEGIPATGGVISRVDKETHSLAKKIIEISKSRKYISLEEMI